MPRVDHPNIGDVLKYVYLTATITEVDGSNDTVNFTGIDDCPDGTDIPLFYHCTPESELRDNGALEGAAGAFITDDEVIVQCEIESAGHYKPVRVIGFTDKPKSCGFMFKIIRDDETVMTDSEEHYVGMQCYDSDENEVDITCSYDSESEYWTAKKEDESAFDDPDGYWWFFSCQYCNGEGSDPEGCISGIYTGYAPGSVQYPYRYKECDQYKKEDLLIPGHYEVKVPFVRLIVGTDASFPVCSDWTPSAVPPCQDTEDCARYVLFKGHTFNRTLKVISSIPYKLKWQVGNYIHQDIYYHVVCSSGDEYYIRRESQQQSRVFGGSLDVTVTGPSFEDQSAEAEYPATDLEGEDYVISATGMSPDPLWTYWVVCGEWRYGSLVHERLHFWGDNFCIEYSYDF